MTAISVSPGKAIFIQKHGSVLTPPGIVTFAAIARKWKNREKPDDDGKFAVSVIFPPGCDWTALKDLVNKTGSERFKSEWAKPAVKKPWLRAEEKLDPDRMPEGFDPTNWIMLRADTYKARPQVVYANKEEVAEDDLVDQLYNGREVRITVRPAAYPNGAASHGNKGVKLYLGNIQLLRQLEPWPGNFTTVAASEEFDAVDIPDDPTTGGKKAADNLFGDDEIPF